jgi:hypothetical protein
VPPESETFSLVSDFFSDGPPFRRAGRAFWETAMVYWLVRRIWPARPRANRPTDRTAERVAAFESYDQAKAARDALLARLGRTAARLEIVCDPT